MFSEASFAHFMYSQFLVTPEAATPSDVNLSGQTGIVTGSNIGLGLEASRQLLQLGLSHLILGVRDESKGLAAREDLLKSATSSEARVEVWKVDMLSYESILAFAKRCETLPRLDFAILNAGLANFKMEINPFTGYEETLQVNHISTALLAILLLPVLRAGRGSGSKEPGRLTIVSSETAFWAAFKEQNFDPLLSSFNDPKLYDSVDRYYTSKLLELIFLRELCRQVSASEVVINAVNPGFCYGSGLHRHATGIFGAILNGYKRVVGRSISIGARTLVNAAVVQKNATHGKYLSDNRVTSYVTPFGVLHMLAGPGFACGTFTLCTVLTLHPGFPPSSRAKRASGWKRSCGERRWGSWKASLRWQLSWIAASHSVMDEKGVGEEAYS